MFKMFYAKTKLSYTEKCIFIRCTTVITKDTCAICQVVKMITFYKIMNTWGNRFNELLYRSNVLNTYPRTWIHLLQILHHIDRHFLHLARHNEHYHHISVQHTACYVKQHHMYTSGYSHQLQFPHQSIRNKTYNINMHLHKKNNSTDAKC